VRVLEEYDLHGLGAEPEELWTVEDDRSSLRNLSAYLNQQLLKQALENADKQILDGEVENIYRLLTDDEVSSAERMRVRRRLERDDVDIEALESDFVTYQAIRTYLQEHRGAEYTPAKTEPLEREAMNLQQMRGRTAVVTEKNSNNSVKTTNSSSMSSGHSSIFRPSVKDVTLSLMFLSYLTVAAVSVADSDCRR